MKIRRATKEDIPSMVRLWEEYMDFHKKDNPYFTRADDGYQEWAKYAQERMNTDDALVLVAEEGQNIVGILLCSIMLRPSVMRERRHGYILDQAVTEKYRRRGIGESLYQEAKKWFLSNGVYRVHLRIVTSNPVAASFWKKMGFKTFVEEQYAEI